jgi:rhodanese-related sulfurtransferase
VEPFVSPDALAAERQRGKAPVIVDVRDADEYAAGHVAGARNIPFGELADRLRELPAGEPVVTYCNMRHRGESRGERAAALLRERRYDASVLDGGFPAWERAGLPVGRQGAPTS